MQLSDFDNFRLAFDNYEGAYEVFSRLQTIVSDKKRDYITVKDVWQCAEMPTVYHPMSKWGWNSLKDFSITTDGPYYILKLPPARPVEEFKQNKEMKKPTMDLKNSLYTSTSTATVNWQDEHHDSTFTLTNPAITIGSSTGCPSNITITGDTIGSIDWGSKNSNHTDYASFFDEAASYLRSYIGKEEINVNTVAKRNGKSIVEATKFKKIEVYNDRVVKITFADGTYTKAVCSNKDVFCLDTGIMVCVMKKLFGGQKEGTKLIALMLDDAHTQMEKQINDKIEAENKRIAEKQKKRKAELKKAAKKMKAKEEAIDIQKQAYIRAMQEMGMTKDE